MSALPVNSGTPARKITGAPTRVGGDADDDREEYPAYATRMIAANLKSVEPGMLLPDITVNTSPEECYPIKQMQMMRFNGERWERFWPDHRWRDRWKVIGSAD